VVACGDDMGNDFACAEGNTCRVGFTAQGSTGPAAANLYCLTDENNGATEVGGPCAQNANCQSGYCYVADDGQGTCSHLCAAPEDCTVPTMACGPTTLVDRKGTANDLKVDVCQPKTACGACKYDANCLGDYLCTNIGGAAAAADLVCAQPCTDDADCTDPTGGAVCTLAKDANGNLKPGVTVCQPAACL